MDPISYGVAAKQKQRIEKVIAEPDSTSGVITVPQVIATGETITIPAGRTAVLPNTTVNGTLVIDGEVFVPSGSSVSTTEVDATVVKQNGNVVANDSTVVHKTGNETIAGVKTFSNNTVFNSNVGIGTSSPSYRIDALGFIKSGGIGQDGGFIFARSSDNVIASSIILNSSTQILEYKNALGSGIHSFVVNNTERVRIDSSGNVLLTGSGGLGYGTGSGGTVTQLTNKSTAVTLNKPCGQIVMNNAALAAGASVTFQFNNSVLNAVTDSLLLTINNPISGYSYRVDVAGLLETVGAQIRVTNTSGSTLSDAITINFAVIKGATA